MPLRMLKPTLRTSERWNRSTYFVRCLYISLLNLVDDYGRYEANATLLASECFPYGDEEGLPMTSDKIDGGLRALASKDLILVYRDKGKQFLQIKRWHERVRQIIQRYPEPSKCEIVWGFMVDDGQLPDNCQQNADNCRPPIPVPTPIPIPLESVHREPPKPPKEPIQRFAPPSLEEIKLHGAKIGLPESECLKCHAYYTSNGWKVGRNPMKCWKAAMIHWRSNWMDGQRYKPGRQNPNEPSREQLDKLKRTVSNL